MNNRITVHKLEYVYAMDNYSYYNTKKNDVHSPVFSAITKSEYKWHLKVKLNRDYCLGLYLLADHIDKKGTIIFARFRFAILDDQLEVKRIRCCRDIRGFKLGSEQGGWGFNRFIAKSELHNLLLNDKFTVYCAVIFSEKNDFAEDFDQFIPTQLQTLCNDYSLSKNFESLLTNQEFSDVVLSVNGKEFHVHKNILAARSPVFNRMFKNDMTESNKNFVEITDMDEKVVEEMLRYIYTGKREESPELVEQLFTAADKYELNGLKFRCEKVLSESLSLKNATRILVLADMHVAEKLKSAAISFIVDNAKEIVKSAEWKAMVVYHPLLFNEVFTASLVQKED